MAEDVVGAAQRAIGILLVPRSGDGASERRQAKAAVGALLELAGRGEPVAVDEVRRLALRRDVVAAADLPLHELLRVLPVGWHDQVIEVQAPGPAVCIDLAGHLPDGPTRTEVVRRGLRQCTRAREGTELRRLLGIGPPLDAVEAILGDPRWMRKVAVRPSEVVCLVGPAAVTLVDATWPEAELVELLGPAAGPELRSAALQIVLARPRLSLEALRACAAAAARPDERREVGRRVAIEVRSAAADLLARLPAAPVAELDAIEGQLRVLRSAAASIDEPGEVDDVGQRLERVRSELERRIPHRYEGELEALLAPRLPYERWRAMLEHLARRAEVAARSSEDEFVGHWLRDVAVRARGRAVAADLVPPSPPWASPIERPSTCPWCGAWCGIDWNHCGSCGSIRRHHPDPPEAWSVAPA